MGTNYYCIDWLATIVLAEYVYPERWANLLKITIAYIEETMPQTNTHLLTGCIHALLGFTPLICGLQIPTITHVLFPLLLRILELSPSPMPIQINTLQIYQNSLNITLEMSIIHREICKQRIQPIMAKYLSFINDWICRRETLAIAIFIELRADQAIGTNGVS